jgi:hypothetical protein
MRSTRVAALILAVGLAVLPAGLAVAQPTPGAGRSWCRSTRRRRAVRVPPLVIVSWVASLPGTNRAR